MKRIWLFFGLCATFLSACNLVYRHPEDASIDEQTSEFASASESEILVALPTEALTVEPLVSCRPRFDWMGYVVGRGDTLSGIAVRSKSAVAELAEANCLDNPNLIIEGQRIYVRQRPVSPTPVHVQGLGTDFTETEDNR